MKPSCTIAFTLALLGCGSHPLDISVLALNVVGGVTVSVSSPVDFEITATNNGTERIVWGRGSSSCQFGLFVVGRQIGRHDIQFRACTDDLAEQGLAPGESRTETIRWDGQISVSGLMSPLPAGQYEIYATAGSDFESRALVVSVVGA